jgi:hypothetical protein
MFLNKARLHTRRRVFRRKRPKKPGGVQHSKLDGLTQVERTMSRWKTALETIGHAEIQKFVYILL